MLPPPSAHDPAEHAAHDLARVRKQQASVVSQQEEEERKEARRRHDREHDLDPALGILAGDGTGVAIDEDLEVAGA